MSICSLTFIINNFVVIFKFGQTTLRRYMATVQRYTAYLISPQGGAHQGWVSSPVMGYGCKPF